MYLCSIVANPNPRNPGAEMPLCSAGAERIEVSTRAPADRRGGGSCGGSGDLLRRRRTPDEIHTSRALFSSLFFPRNITPQFTRKQLNIHGVTYEQPKIKLHSQNSYTVRRIIKGSTLTFKHGAFYT